MVGMQRFGTPKIHLNQFLDNLCCCEQTALAAGTSLLLGACGLLYRATEKQKDKRSD
jgi:hypothetical protein